MTLNLFLLVLKSKSHFIEWLGHIRSKPNHFNDLKFYYKRVRNDVTRTNVVSEKKDSELFQLWCMKCKTKKRVRSRNKKTAGQDLTYKSIERALNNTKTNLEWTTLALRKPFRKKSYHENRKKQQNTNCRIKAKIPLPRIQTVSHSTYVAKTPLFRSSCFGIPKSSLQFDLTLTKKSAPTQLKFVPLTEWRRLLITTPIRLQKTWKSVNRSLKTDNAPIQFKVFEL